MPLLLLLGGGAQVSAGVIEGGTAADASNGRIPIVALASVVESSIGDTVWWQDLVVWGAEDVVFRMTSDILGATYDVSSAAFEAATLTDNPQANFGVYVAALEPSVAADAPYCAIEKNGGVGEGATPLDAWSAVFGVSAVGTGAAAATDASGYWYGAYGVVADAAFAVDGHGYTYTALAFNVEAASASDATGRFVTYQVGAAELAAASDFTACLNGIIPGLIGKVLAPSSGRVGSVVAPRSARGFTAYRGGYGNF